MSAPEYVERFDPRSYEISLTRFRAMAKNVGLPDPARDEIEDAIRLYRVMSVNDAGTPAQLRKRLRDAAKAAEKFSKAFAGIGLYEFLALSFPPFQDAENVGRRIRRLQNETAHLATWCRDAASRVEDQRRRGPNTDAIDALATLLDAILRRHTGAGLTKSKSPANNFVHLIAKIADPKIKAGSVDGAIAAATAASER